MKSRKAKIKNIIRKNSREIAARIKELIPVLRGWDNYFKISYHSQSTFISIGHLVWQQMMQWVRIKHPRKTNS